MADIFVNHTGDDTTGANEATAYNELQTAINNSANGDRIWVKIDSVYYITATVDISPAAGYTSGRLIEAYYQTLGDCRRGQPYFGYRAVFDGQGLAMNCFDYISSEWVLANIHATNVDGYLFNFGTSGYHRTLINCSGDPTYKYQLYSGYSYMRVILVDCHFVNDFHITYARGYSWFLKNCWLENNATSSSSCVSGSCYSLNIHNCILLGSDRAGSQGCLQQAYSLNLTNSIVKGYFGLKYTGPYTHYLALNNYFVASGKPLDCSYGIGGLFDYNACNTSVFGTNKMIRFGEHNLVNVDPYENFVDWDNKDFRLKDKSVLKAAGQPVVSGSTGGNTLYTGQANIGPYLEFPKPTPRSLFKQGG